MIEIIAEIGKNFVTTPEPEKLGYLMTRAKWLIDEAKEAGVDTVKFQIHNVDDEIHPLANLISPHFNHDRYEWVKRNTYPAEFWFELKEYCKQVEIGFLATPMSRGAAEILNEEVGTDGWKIGSGDILDFVMLDYIRDSGKPVILSSGMSFLNELKLAFDFLKEKTPEVSILHCVSKYPCELHDLNLDTIPLLKEKFNVPVGFSDHSLGIEGSLMAVKLGAVIIEKHLTLDRNAWGPDHKTSLLPAEMKELVKRIKTNDLIEPTPQALGIPAKALLEEEVEFRKVFRKGLYASRDLKEGDMLEHHDIISLRPLMKGSIPSEKYLDFVGKVLKKDRIKDGGLDYESIS